MFLLIRVTKVIIKFTIHNSQFTIFIFQTLLFAVFGFSPFNFIFGRRPEGSELQPNFAPISYEAEIIKQLTIGN